MTTVHDPAELVAAMPFAVHAGVTITRADREAVTGHLEWAPERCTVGGLLHGGALMTLADSLGAVAAFLHLPEGAGTATIGSSTTLLRGIREGRAHGVATVLHAGRRTITVRTDLHDDEGRPVATTTQTQAVLT
jgi:1,4-dihydroxy-2-naphthoyl-CoA hydrolase